MITVQAKVHKYTYSKDLIKAFMQALLSEIDYPDFDIGILLTTNKTIRTYNREFRNKDVPTDILSFSYHDTLAPGKRIKVSTEEDKNLGDLILSLEYVEKDAQKKGISFQERLKVLLIHGTCHLLGYDHETDAQWRSMRAKEAFLLKKIGHLPIL